MSRIGKTPVVIEKDVTVDIQGNIVVVKGSKGEMRLTIPKGITVKQNDGVIDVTRVGDDKKIRAIHGFVSATLKNHVEGVSKGFTKTLELSGVGYRVSLSGVNLNLTIGFSHEVKVEPPKGITFSVVEGKIVVSGIDKNEVGQTAAKIREIKKPEPYKGKGIKYVGEVIRKKAGKAKAVGGAPGAK